MKYFTQNTKLKKDNIYSFNLEPLVTCPGAGKCIKYCFGCKGQFRIFRTNSKKSWDKNFQLTQQANFVEIITKAIKATKKPIAAIRVHATGDFKTQKYIEDWYKIANNCPNIQFYCYTKSFAIGLDFWMNKPNNFKVIQSEGSINDNLIDWNKPIARIFNNCSDMNKIPTDNWLDCSQSDLLALSTNRIGLIFH